MKERETHIKATLANDYTMCGRKANGSVSYLWLYWLPAHLSGRASVGRTMKLCPACMREHPTLRRYLH